MASYNLGKVVGDDGVSLEYDWEGTSLGIKREDEAEYSYTDLKGQTGNAGQDGYSPTVSTSKSGKTTTIEITDKNGVHTATINDGEDGTNDYNDLINKPDLSQYITKSVDDLVNYYKKSETYTQAEINALIGAISTINLLVVQTLPTEDISTTTIYLVPKTTSSTNNVYDEYIYVSNAWEKIGSTEVDLSNYYTKTEADALLDDKQDTLTAGDNITIDNNVISASGGGSTYFLTTPFTTATQSTSLNSDDIATLNKVIDDFRAGKDFVLIAKKMMFKTNNSITQYSYNVIGNVRGSNKTFYIDFYRNTGAGTNAYPISFADNSLVRTITLNNVSTPANISSASLPTQPTVNSNDNIITTGNTTSYNVTGDYNPAHKSYVDNAVSGRIAQYSTMPTASSSNVGNIVQFVGTTDTYTNGYFYKCVEDNNVYSWVNIQVQQSGSVEQDTYYWDCNDTTANREMFQELYNKIKLNKPFTLYIPARDLTNCKVNVNCYLYQLGDNMQFRILPNYINSKNIYYNDIVVAIFNNDILTTLNTIYVSSSITRTKWVKEYNTNAGYNMDCYVLGTNNTKSYTPSADYHPATKKYVDDSIANAITDALGGSY